MCGLPEYRAHAAEYRAQAAACMRNAEKNSNQAILLTAHMWLRMADEAEFIHTKVSDLSKPRLVRNSVNARAVMIDRLGSPRAVVGQFE